MKNKYTKLCKFFRRDKRQSYKEGIIPYSPYSIKKLHRKSGSIIFHYSGPIDEETKEAMNQWLKKREFND